MSLRLEMLRVARSAPRLLSESTELVCRFLHRQQNPDGGFRNRAGHSDLYYTVFALDCLSALQAKTMAEGTLDYLRSFGEGAGLDFVHVCCLARAWTSAQSFGGRATPPSKEVFSKRIEAFRCNDGGYHPQPQSRSGTPYGAFLALGAFQDLELEVPEAKRLVISVQGLQKPDGSWANEGGVPLGATNATAAAVAVLSQLAVENIPKAGDWLLARRHPRGGFLATPSAPIPDLLSTATAVHALAALGVPLDGLKEGCLDFIDSLWTNEGAFYGHWADDALDCEYLFYALLALGHFAQSASVSGV